MTTRKSRAAPASAVTLESPITLGPLLSFRGLSPDNNHWRVTALIGIDVSAPTPAMLIEGRDAGPPRILLTYGARRYLRYDLTCPVEADERRVEYGLADGPKWTFTVPGRAQCARMAYVSCNGFSDPNAMRKVVKPQNAVWEDFLYSHDRRYRGDKLLDKEQLWHETRVHDRGVQRFHLLLMGGDQIYFDSIWGDIPALQEWVGKSRQEQLSFPVSDELDRAIEAYYFTLYEQRWLPRSRGGWGSATPAFDAADAMAGTPTIMMWDDHDIFDGWGSYTCEMQQSPLFKTLFRHARRAFWVFQMQHVLSDLPDLMDATPPGFAAKDPMYADIPWADVLRGDPLALPLLYGQPGFSSFYEVGAVALAVPDLRTERSRTQVLGANTWARIKDRLGMLDGPDSPGQSGQPGRHLIIMSSVPVVHPKLALAEGWVDTFGQDRVLDSAADDLRDQWAHDDHEGERKRLLEVLTAVAKSTGLHVSVVSGDVHVAASGVAYPHGDTSAAVRIPQFTSSAVVHPSLTSIAERLFLLLLNNMAAKPQVIDAAYVAEMLMFPAYNEPIMAARNWLALEIDESTAERKLWATWRCEREDGFSNHLLALPSGNG
ncbi:hypothetical protein AKI39_01985 [Bordetella sp. H567]|uniref:alkaline phosphatase family protein n=1 Tax=Bordetella sp. H567 TaxID=1697043 RepID=UPI00081C453F|nr:alkaline phosphatase family protein [Bordetella sp. H567]AOB29715.1 hypothetical protein AKI39_01985 [Bordetella sp. H567]